jgi:hypothetical protein
LLETLIPDFIGDFGHVLNSNKENYRNEFNISKSVAIVGRLCTSPLVYNRNEFNISKSVAIVGRN